ncbi:DUF1295 domain-containing protein [Cellulomonas hominis]
MSALDVNLWICAAVTVVCWLASVLTREYSWVDRIWSVVPVVYLWVFAAHTDEPRVTLMAVLVTAWGVRLTFNFARRGGYAPGGEDYRWSVLRGRLPGWRFQVLNVLFIAVYQNAVLLAITLPAWTASQRPRAIGAADVLAAVVFVALLVGETVADQQRWSFHRAPGAHGVLRSGLFRYSRHPNYFCELGQWWVVYAFGAIAAGTPWVATVAGAVLLTLLFIGSTVFTEQISAQRHADHEDYRRSTSMLVPWRPRSEPARR